MKITKSVRPFLSRSLWQTASPNGNELKITMVAPEQLQAIAGVCVNDDLFIRFRTLSHNLSNYSSGKFQIRTIWHEISMQWGTPNGKKRHAEPLKAIVNAINTIFFALLNGYCCVFLFIIFVPFSHLLNTEKDTERVVSIFFIVIIFIRCMLLMIARPSSMDSLLPMFRWTNFIADLRQVNLFVRALMCKPLNNHKIKIIARKNEIFEWNEKIVIYISLWRLSSKREKKKSLLKSKLQGKWVRMLHSSRILAKISSFQLNLIKDLWDVCLWRWMAYQIYGHHKWQPARVFASSYSCKPHERRQKINRGKCHTDTDTYRNYLCLGVRNVFVSNFYVMVTFYLQNLDFYSFIFSMFNRVVYRCWNAPQTMTALPFSFVCKWQKLIENDKIRAELGIMSSK